MELFEYDAAIHKKSRVLSLQTHVYNVGAQVFYRKNQFKPTGSEDLSTEKRYGHFCRDGDHLIRKFYKQIWPKQEHQDLIHKVDANGGCQCFRVIRMTKDLTKRK